MKRGIWIALVLAGCLGVAPCLIAQSDAGQTKAAGKGKKDAQQSAPQAPQKPADPNAFPTDTSDVPVLPTKSTDAPASNYSDVNNAAASLPGDDVDPVRSPDAGADSGATAQDFTSTSSSRSSNLDSLLPNPGDEDTPTKRGRKNAAPDGPPKETAQQDLTVAKYYLDQKNWKAAQSRFQSALVLSPEDPEVYWGLAESARHMGDFATARTNYLKVIEYDPDSRHAKDAQKALKDPQIAEAKAGAGPQ